MIIVKSIRTSDAPDDVLREIRELLDVAFVGDLTDDDWAHTIGGTHVLVRADEVLVAHAAVVERVLHIEDRPVRTGYVEGVATHPARQGDGHSTRAMERIGDHVRESFEPGALSTGAHRFYERLGWERWHRPTFVRTEGVAERTPEDDDGIMVLRFGATAAKRLDAHLTCEHRAGDVW